MFTSEKNENDNRSHFSYHHNTSIERNQQPPNTTSSVGSAEKSKNYTIYGGRIEANATSSVSDGKVDTIYGVCPFCGNPTLNVSPATGIHHSRLDCLGCGRFVRWVGSPKIESNDERLRQRIESIPLEKLKAWPHTFIADLQRQARISRRDRKRFKLSPKQIAKIEEIEAQVQGVAS